MPRIGILARPRVDSDVDSDYGSAFDFDVDSGYDSALDYDVASGSDPDVDSDVDYDSASVFDSDVDSGSDSALGSDSITTGSDWASAFSAWAHHIRQRALPENDSEKVEKPKLVVSVIPNKF